MQFYKDRLSLEVDSDLAVRKLKRTYSKYFEEPMSDVEGDADDDQEGS
jgi:hypothetical protein